MNDERYRKVEALFQHAVDLPHAQRAAYLDEQDGSDPIVRTQVERMLSRFEKEPVSSLVDAERLDELDGDLTGGQVGPFKLVRLIGEGGFGAVYAARQESPVQRDVAFKIIKLGMDTKKMIARFEAERQALAIMDHPNIAKVLDAGATDAGRPYFVMELVDGVPITQYCDEHRLATRERLDLFAAVCDAVQHAHQKGVIHRDLKPSNVLVASCDGKPLPKVIDFGIAKATSGHLGGQTLLTASFRFIGTPQYMSPEQAEMSGVDIDTRSDIYSLGVILYELLTGTTPFDSKTLQDAGHRDIQRILLSEEPPTPSQRLSTLGESATTVAASRRVETPTLRKLLRGDLDWIAMKALEKDRTRRYETAAALASDVRRHLGGEPVSAGPPGPMYKVSKFVRRNRVSVVTASLALAAILVGLTVAVTGLVRARSEAVSAQAINTFFNDMLASVDPLQLQQVSALTPDDRKMPVAAGGFARDVSVAEMVQAASADIDAAFQGKPRLEAKARETIGMTLRGLGRYSEARPQLEAALAIRSRILGPDHPDTLRSTLLLGDLVLDAGGAVEAETLVRTALAGLTRVYGETHAKTLSCSTILAVVLTNQCRHVEACRIFEETLAAQRLILGDEHRDTLTTMWKWSVALLARKMAQPGESLARELHEIVGRTLSPEDSFNVLATPLLGWWSVIDRDYERAESSLRPGLAKCRRILGEEHPFTHLTRHGLARSLHRSECIEEKMALYRRAFDGLRATRGRFHWQSLSAADDFAHWLDERGSFEEAERLYRELYHDGLQAFGGFDGYTIHRLGVLADFLERAGKSDEAIALHRERLRILKDQEFPSRAVRSQTDILAKTCLRHGKIESAREITQQLIDQARAEVDQNPESYVAHNALAWLLLTCLPEEMREAEAALVSAKRAAELPGGSVSPVLDTLALAYRSVGDIDQAVKVQLRANARIPLGARNESHYIFNLAHHFLARGDVAEARRYMLDLVSRTRRAMGADNPALADWLTSAADRMAEAGGDALAEDLLREAVMLTGRVRGERHPQLAEKLGQLAEVLERQGDCEEAMSIHARHLALLRDIHGDDTLPIALAHQSMGRTQYECGDLTAARKAWLDALEILRRLGLSDRPPGIAVEGDLAKVMTAATHPDRANPPPATIGGED